MIGEMEQRREERASAGPAGCTEAWEMALRRQKGCADGSWLPQPADKSPSAHCEWQAHGHREIGNAETVTAMRVVGTKM